MKKIQVTLPSVKDSKQNKRYDFQIIETTTTEQPIHYDDIDIFYKIILYDLKNIPDEGFLFIQEVQNSPYVEMIYYNQLQKITERGINSEKYVFPTGSIVYFAQNNEYLQIFLDQQTTENQLLNLLKRIL